MTTTIAFATRDCIVCGCDSLGTSSANVLNPNTLIQNFFDEDGRMKIKEDGSPALASIEDLGSSIVSVPLNQLPKMTKLFHLKPAYACVLTAGAAIIGELSLRQIIERFLDDNGKQLKRLSIEHISNQLFEHVNHFYSDSFDDGIGLAPLLELIVSGYSPGYKEPEIFEISFRPGGERSCENRVPRGQHNVMFGGQYDVISRVIQGIDDTGRQNHYLEVFNALDGYKGTSEALLKEQGITIELPTVEEYVSSINFNFNWAKGITADLSNFSEQNAIELVHFLVEIMINSQKFSDRLPTVGGDIHIAMITRERGFQWISAEELQYQGRTIPKYAPNK